MINTSLLRAGRAHPNGPALAIRAGDEFGRAIEADWLPSPVVEAPNVQVGQWSLLDHCGVRNVLERDGWRYVAAGDWAIVLADPTDRYAARISPFEPAYQHFVALCRRLPSNRWLPKIWDAADLEGGGHVTVMERLTPRVVPDDDAPDPLWSSNAADLVDVRHEVERIDRACRSAVPWWGGLDVRADHFMLDRTGQLKLVDPFYVAGVDLFGAAQSDYREFCKILPADRRRYMLQIPHFSQPYAADQLAALRKVVLDAELAVPS